MRKFRKKQLNKIIAKVDRYFTYDKRTLVPGERFMAIEYDGKSFVDICETHCKYLGIWCYYSVVRNGQTIKYGNYCKTYKELNEFVRKVQLIG